MIKSVVLLDSGKSQYDVVSHFTKSLAKGFEKSGVSAKIIKTTAIDQSVVGEMSQLKADLVVSFFSFFDVANDAFFSRMLPIPVLYVTVDGPEYFINKLQNENCFLSVRDYYSFKMVSEIGKKKLIVLLHACDNDFSVPVKKDRPYPVVFFGTALPPNAADEELSRIPSPIQSALRRAVELNLKNPYSSHYDSLLFSLKQDPEINRNMLLELNLYRLLQIMELKVRAHDRIDLINSIKDHEVHVFGGGFLNASWKDYLHNDNIVLHEQISFEDTLKIMAQSKIVLSSSPHIRFGGHERIFYAYQMGALPLVNFTPFVEEEFKIGESIETYYPGHLTEVDKTISKYLNDETLRDKLVIEGRKIVQERHTWDNRAQQILEQLKPFFSDEFKS